MGKQALRDMGGQALHSMAKQALHNRQFVNYDKRIWIKQFQMLVPAPQQRAIGKNTKLKYGSLNSIKLVVLIEKIRQEW